MFRTRNVAILATFVSMGALGATVALFDAGILGRSQAAALGFVDAGEQSYSATVAPTADDDRESRLESLRKKLAKRNLGEAEPVKEEPEVIATTTEESPEESEELASELRCGAYSVYSGGWNSRGVKISEAEGARIVYREAVPTASSSVPQREVLAELPVRSASSGAKHCIASDVIGISKNGALIRNSDARAYAGFGAGTLIGYTLDGFPLYGGLSAKADACGGAVENGQYRYGLSANRDTVINCFAAPPVTL